MCWEIKNYDMEQVRISLIELSPNGEVSVLFPGLGQDHRIPALIDNPGPNGRKPGRLPIKKYGVVRPCGNYIMKIIATVAKADFRDAEFKLKKDESHMVRSARKKNPLVDLFGLKEAPKTRGGPFEEVLPEFKWSSQLIHFRIKAK
jgi:hypothetical protein